MLRLSYWKTIVASLILLAVGAALLPFPLRSSSAQAATSYPWEALKPAMTNPKTIYLTDSDPSYQGNGNEDLIVVVPRPMTRTARIGRVRNLIMIGAEFTIGRRMPNPLPSVPNNCAGFERLHTIASEHKALSLANITGVAYIEGLYVNGTNGNLTEGVQVYDSTGRKPQAKFYFINSRFEGGWTHQGIRAVPDEVWPSNMPSCKGGLASRPKFNKPDLLEGMYGSYYLWNVTARGSAFQGIYFTPEHGNSLGEVQLRNVNVAESYRQGYAIHRSARSGGPVWTLSENAWLDHDLSYTYNKGPESPYMYFDKPDEVTGSTTNGQVRWTRTTSVVKAGLVMQRGVPPQGDFAPADKVGQRYDPAYFATGGATQPVAPQVPTQAPTAVVPPQPTTTPPVAQPVGPTQGKLPPQPQMQPISKRGPQLSDLSGIREQETLAGRVYIEAKAADRADVVEFKLSGPKTHADSERAAPYFWMSDERGKPHGWDTTDWPNGIYILSAQACRDGQCGNIVSRTFRIDNTRSSQQPLVLSGVRLPLLVAP
jgi:hypothetical protein